MDFPHGSASKEPACNAGDPGSIPGLGRSSGESNGNPLQYSCLETPMDRGACWATIHGVAQSQTRLGDFTFPLLVATYRISKASYQILHYSSQTLVAAFRFSSSEACGILVPPTGLNPCPLQGRFLATGLPRKSSNWQIFKNWISFTLLQWRSLGTSLHIVSWLENYLQIFSEQELSPFYRPSIVPGAEDTKDSKA